MEAGKARYLCPSLAVWPQLRFSPALPAAGWPWAWPGNLGQAAALTSPSSMQRPACLPLSLLPCSGRVSLAAQRL